MAKCVIIHFYEHKSRALSKLTCTHSFMAQTISSLTLKFLSNEWLSELSIFSCHSYYMT